MDFDNEENESKEHRHDRYNRRGDKVHFTQCYDEVATMQGSKNDIASQFKSLNEKMSFLHYYGHALNVTVKDSCRRYHHSMNTLPSDSRFQNSSKIPQRGT